MRCLCYYLGKKGKELIIGYIKRIEGSETCGKQRCSDSLHAKISIFGCVAYHRMGRMVASMKFCGGQKVEPPTIVTHDIIAITLSLICA